MKKNMGLVDRVIRIFIAIIIAVLIFTGVIKGVWLVVLAVFAAVFLITSLVGFCPLYKIVGAHTLRCRVGNDD